MSLKVSPENLQRLHDLRVKQNQNGHGFGVLVWEYRITEKKLYAEHRQGTIKDAELVARLGALRHEYLQKEAFWSATIDRTAAEAINAGVIALRQAGVNPEKGDFTVNEKTGEVLQDQGEGFKPVEILVLT